MLGLRNTHGDQRGFTLVELLTSMTILSIVLTIVFTFLFSVQKGYEESAKRSQTNDEMRLAMEQLDHEIRSASAFSVVTDSSFKTAISSPTDRSLFFVAYTQTSAPTRDPGFNCIQWKLDSGKLYSRMWPLSWAQNLSKVTAWRTVATNLKTPTTGLTTDPAASYFMIPSTPAYGFRVVQVKLVANVSTNGKSSNVVQTRSIDGRNVLSTSTTAGEPNPCTSSPPP